jgi:hypothetical protein
MAERVTLDFLVIHDFLDGGEVLPETDTTTMTVSRSSIEWYTARLGGINIGKVGSHHHRGPGESLG